VHDKTKPALQLLESEGFSCKGYVDIFDAGPTVEAKLQNIRTVNASRKMPIIIGDVDNGQAQESFIINTKISAFRAVCAQSMVDEKEQKLVVSNETAKALGIGEDEYVRFSPSSIKG
jgi:arginine N-succinyltransferase